MANYARVKLSGSVTAQEVQEAAEEFNATVLRGLFRVENDNGGFAFWYEDEVPVLFTHTQYDKDRKPLAQTVYYNLMQHFWLGSEARRSKRGRTVEFKHGHALTFAWWVDSELEYFLARKFGGKVDDDGCGRMDIPPAPRTYAQYVSQYPEHMRDGMMKDDREYLTAHAPALLPLIETAKVGCMHPSQRGEESSSGLDASTDVDASTNKKSEEAADMKKLAYER